MKTVFYGFEDGTHTGWYSPWSGQLSVTSEQAYAGNKSLKISGRQNSWDSPAINLYNMIKQNGAGTYMVQMSVLVDDLVEGGEYGHLLIRGNQANSFITSRGNGNYYYKLTSTVKFVENEWYHFTGSFVVTNSDISATSGLFNLCFDFITPTANQNIYIDNVRVVKMDPLQVIPTAETLYVGDRLILDVNRYNYTTYTSSNPSVATVDSNGIVLAIASGRTTVTVNYNNIETVVEAAEIATFDNSTNIVELTGDSIKVNERGWIAGMDNRRINIYSDSEGVLIYNGEATTECAEKAYSAEGILLGSVWQFGNTGTKMYVLYNGEYVITNSTNIKIEYMNNGYYDKIIEISEVSENATVEIENYESKEISVQQPASYNGKDKQPTIHIY